MRAWAGLGYYSRARNLKAAAEAVAAMGGAFPDTAEALQRLPGIGAYTAAAIAAIAFDRPEPVVDGNIERVIARLFAMAISRCPRRRPAIRARQAELTPQERPGDYAQAMMDLGATICTPKRPACALCPLDDLCLGMRGDPEAFPVKAAKAERPTRYGDRLCRGPRRRCGAAAQAPAEGPARRHGGSARERLERIRPKRWRRRAVRPRLAQDPGKVVHVFTHFRLELDVFVGEASARAEAPRDAGGRRRPTCRAKPCRA